MTSVPLPLPDVTEEDTKPLVYTPPVSTLDLFTVDVPRKSTPRPLPFEPITTRRKLANTLRQLANYLEGVK